MNEFWRGFFCLKLFSFQISIKKVRLKGTDAGEESVIDSFQSHKVRLKGKERI